MKKFASIIAAALIGSAAPAAMAETVMTRVAFHSGMQVLGSGQDSSTVWGQGVEFMDDVEVCNGRHEAWIHSRDAILINSARESVVNGFIVKIAVDCSQTVMIVQGFGTDIVGRVKGITIYPRIILDIDDDGDVNALTDGILVVRYQMGFRGEALTIGAVGTGANRNDEEIEDYLESLTR